jgi:hypothetical protein
MKEILEIFSREHFMNSPATEAEIIAFEHRVGWNLDVDPRAFYGFANGGHLFDKSDPPFTFLSLSEITRTRVAVCGRDEPEYGPASWWAVADVQDGNFLAVDLDQRDSRGRFAIRDIFHEVPDNPEYCSIICLSFGELLARALASNGKHFWLKG